MNRCQWLIETSRSNSLRALYGPDGLSRTRRCKRAATARYYLLDGSMPERLYCTQHDPHRWAGSIDPWVVADASTHHHRWGPAYGRVVRCDTCGEEIESGAGLPPVTVRAR